MPEAFSPIFDIHTTTNTHDLNMNCYYCAVAALNNMTADDLVNRSETMQQDGADTNHILALFRRSGTWPVAVKYYVPNNGIETLFENLPVESGLGLGYDRANGTAHMVVLAKDSDGVVKCVDYQTDPPTISDFPPEPDIIRAHIFYIDRSPEGAV